ncbi:MAG: hypothetical protein LBJ09_03970 [Clostridiales bacterium]|jgi:hypothetical protein|nr:hypothetical protein [Clostridiales bacterium]
MTEIKIGLISELKNKKKYLNFISFKKIKIKIENLNNYNAKIICAIIPYTYEKISKLTAEKREGILKNIAKLFKFYEVNDIIYERKLKELFTEQKFPGDFKVVMGDKIFRRLIPDTIKKIMKTRKMTNLNTRLGISDNSMSFITEYLIKKLCYDSKQMKIYTRNIKKANTIEEKILEETGLPLQIFSSSDKYFDKSDIFIDVDENKIKFKDALIDKIEYELEIPGYDIDTADLAECLSLSPNEIKIKYLSGDREIFSF